MDVLIFFNFVIVIVGVLLILLSIIFKEKKLKKLVKNKSGDYAILIPARDESRVIEKLFSSIKQQNENMDNVYVIVEDSKDPTCSIAHEYGVNVFVRQKPIRKRKGYALDECIKDILKEKHYDLYFIFDADNVLEENFINYMLEDWKKGYEVSIGYRNILNPRNVISGCSILLFSMMNNLVNKKKIKSQDSVIVSGTGYYISGKIIEELGGFPFNSLTEDYELSLYMNSNNVLSTYNEKAIYYDEQPLSMDVSIKQRTRWIKGFFEARKKRARNVSNISSKLGVLPLILIIFGLIFNIIIFIINSIIFGKSFVSLLLLLIVIYVVLLIFTILILINDKKVNMSRSLKIKCLFFNPIFLITFLYCFFKCIFTKNVGWDVIKHGGE